MNDLYVLEGITEADLNFMPKSDSSEFLVFDYDSHKRLSDKNIEHKIIDDFITDFDRREFFDFTNQCLNQINEFNSQNLFFHGVNLLTLIDKNELREFFMNVFPKIKVIYQIIEENQYEKIFLPFSIYNIFIESKFKEKINLINSNQDEYATFEKIDIPINIGTLKSKMTISRERYKTIKQLIEKYVGSLFDLRKNEKKKIVLLEFDPQTYPNLLEEISRNNFKPVLINFRKSPIYNFKTIRQLTKSKSTILIPEDWLSKNELNEFEENKEIFFNYITELMKSKKNLISFEYKNIDFSSFIQKKLNQLLIQRYDEYLMQILVAESIQSRNDIQSILTLNLSGETEKVFSSTSKKIPIILLQHAFANYTESISHFDVLDDFHLIKDRIAVWGNIVRDYLINIKKINPNRILVTGSPKYDIYQKNIQKKTVKKKILVTLRPIINHMEGPRIALFDIYEKTLQKILQISTSNSDIEIIFKLHPQQNTSNEIIRNMIKTNNEIKFVHNQPIRELFQICDLHVNIATDNFDASSVILEAMLSKCPTLNIQLQDTIFDFEFVKMNAIHSIIFTDDIQFEISELLNNEEKRQELFKNSDNFLKKYLSNFGSASTKLVDEIIDLKY